MTSSRLLLGEVPGGVVIQLQGSIRYTMREDLDGLVARLAKESHDRVIVDMRATTEIDSTGLGLIAKLARHAQEAGKPRPCIVTADRDRRLLLTSTGFDGPFELLAEMPCSAGALEECALTDRSSAEMVKVVIEAHRSLMDLSPHNRETYGELLQLLERDLDAHLERARGSDSGSSSSGSGNLGNCDQAP